MRPKGADTVTELVRTAARTLDGREVLRQPPTVLLGVSASAGQALADVDIFTVFDLATSTLFANARELVQAAADVETSYARFGLVPADVLRDGAGLGLKELPLQPITILDGPPKTKLEALASALDVATVRDLAHWPPYLAARSILDETFNPQFVVGDLEVTEHASLPKASGPRSAVNHESLSYPPT